MVELFINLLKTARPRQWIKNLSLGAALLFSGRLFEIQSVVLVGLGVLVFSLLTSSVYFFNDIVDAPRDRLHPFKKLRPIASGKISLPVALFFASLGTFVSLYLAFLLSFFFFLVCLTYFILQIFYTLYLKNLIILDVLAIATSFILRVYAGALLLNYHLSVWFLLCVISLALFMAVGKRRAELAMLNKEAASGHRKTLSIYKEELLDGYLAMFASSAWLSWALFTFFQSPPVVFSPFLHSILPLTFAGSSKLLMITIPVVIYGIMRYLSLIYQGTQAESPERLLLSDKPILRAVLIWFFLVVIIIYNQ